ncbi:MAG: class I adenylate-forming enzyme family protein [Pseudomonadota bacterium]
MLRHAERTPDKVALELLSDGAQAWTYADIKNRVLCLAQGLLDQGFVAGDRIFLQLGNRIETPLIYLAAIAVGLIPVPISAHLTQSELDVMARQLAPAAILSLDAIELGGVPRLGDLSALIAPRPADFVLGDPNRLAYIVFTSGTSGTPRAVAHAHRAVWARQMMIRDWEKLGPDDRLLHSGDFNWTYTMGTGLMDPWAAGATAMIRPAFCEISDLPDLLSQHHATIFATDPGTLRRLLRAPFPSAPRLRHGLSAGAALPASTARKWRDTTGTPIFEAFGQSEVSTFLSSDEHGHLRPQTGRRVAVLDEAGKPAMPDAIGALAVHRSDPGLMLEYIGAPEATADRYMGDWFQTGDVFRQSRDGGLTFVGRADDLLNPGGTRVAPHEIEAALAPFPGIADIAVCEVEIKEATTILACAYTAVTDIDENALNDFAAQHLARYKQPRFYTRLDALPRNANGKLIRKDLPERVLAAKRAP